MLQPTLPIAQVHNCRIAAESRVIVLNGAYFSSNLRSSALSIDRQHRQAQVTQNIMLTSRGGSIASCLRSLRTPICLHSGANAIARRTVTSSTQTTPSADALSTAHVDDASPEPAPQTRPSPFSYHVDRTPSDNLPIYTRLKGHGNRKRVDLVIRRCRGDVGALRNDLQTWLEASPVESSADAAKLQVSTPLTTGDTPTRKPFKGHGKPKSIEVNTRTGHVILNGYAKHRVVQVLTQQGF